MRYLILLSVLGFISLQVQAESSCPAPGPWVSPSSNAAISEKQVMQQIFRQDIVLLGEHHSNPLHHKWHLEILQKIQSGGRPVLLALESFPRKSRDVLTLWNQQKLSGPDFIQQSGWEDYWRYPVELYMPLFELAQSLDIPMYPLNASQELVSRVKHEGWENVTLVEREGIGNPARPTRSYVRRLAESFRRHGRHIADDEVDRAAFKRFVQQQLLWDRAMGQSLAELRAEFPDFLIVAMIGSWHLIDGLGVSHQLKSISENVKLMQIVPWDSHISCVEYTETFSDVIYVEPALRAVSESR